MTANDYPLPTIEHATVNKKHNTGVEVIMDSGWVYYLLNSYPAGTPADEICYFRYGVFPHTFDFDKNFIVVDETNIDPEQIYSIENPKETI